MKLNGWVATTVAIGFACGVSLVAQTTSQPSSSHSTITVTGCLANDSSSGATGTTGTSGTTPSSSTSAEFVLRNAKMGSGSSSSSTSGSTSGTTSSGTTGSSMSGTTGTSGSNYKLEGDSTELTKHVGHEIEVTGTLGTSSNSSSSSSTGSTSGSSTSPYSSASSSSQTLHVDSVRMISASCSR